MSSLKKSQIVLTVFALGIVSLGQAPVAYSKDKDASKKSSAKLESSKKGSDAAKSDAAGDEAAVRATLETISKALAAGDTVALSALWTVDGDYIGVDGSLCKGRENLKNRFNAILAGRGKQEVDLAPENIRFLTSTVALVEGLVRRKDGIEGPKPETRFSMVMQKLDSNWMISSVTEAPLQAQSSIDPLADLAWIVGDWAAENKGGSVHMSAAWAPHKNFIVCTYEMKKAADAPGQESKQIIGWDPRAEQPISWHFDSAGGYGYGTWVKKDKQWLVDASGVDRDGSTNSATNVITIGDNDNFSWQSVNRSLNGLSYNDTEPLKVHRVK